MWTGRLDDDDDDDQSRKPDMPMTSGPVQNALFKGRTVLVFGEIDMRLAERVSAQLLAMAAEGSELLVSPVVELPAPDRRRGPIARWILRHRVDLFRVTAPLAVRLGWGPGDDAGLLVWFPRGGLDALLRGGR